MFTRRLQTFISHHSNSHVITLHPAPIGHVTRMLSDQPDFSNTKESFQSKTLGDVVRAYVVYKMFSYSTIVNNSDKLLRLSRRLLGEKYFNKLMKATVYGQFVAGEDLSGLRPVIQHYREQGVWSILDYAVEDDVPSDKEDEVYLEIRSKKKPSMDATTSKDDSNSSIPLSPTHHSATLKASARTYFYQDEQKCDQNMENFVKCIKTAADVSEGNISFAAIKLTGLGRTEFLLRLSESLNGREEIFNIFSSSDGGTDIYNHFVTMDTITAGLQQLKVDVTPSDIERMFRELDTAHTGALDIFQWTNSFQPGTELYEVLSNKKWCDGQPRLPIMTKIERDQMTSVIRRAEVLSQCASERGIRLMIDAEQTYLQPAIRHIAVNILMPRYNLTSPVVYNTQQCYLKSVYSNIMMDMSMAERVGFHYGVKLVRGAYMEQERQRAIDRGYDDPIWDTKERTDSSYHLILDEVIKRVDNKRTKIMVATHNEASVLHAITRMKEQGIPPDSDSVVFGQLMGMCDHVTFQLGLCGYKAFKYMPYGPVHEVLPYLQRRAHENKGFLKGAVRERHLIAKELRRRLTPHIIGN